MEQRVTRVVIPPTVVVDTREQTPWVAWVWREGRRMLLPVVRRKLVVGDYAIEGYAEEFAIERKSLADWIGTMFSSVETADGEKATSWERFRREIVRAREGWAPADGGPVTPPLQRFAVFVEGSRADVLAHRYRSAVHPHSVLGRSDSLFPDHGFPVFWAQSEGVDVGADIWDFAAGRADAERLAMWTLARWWERREREKGAVDVDIARAFRLAAKGAAPAPLDTRAPEGFVPPAVQYDAAHIGLRQTRRRA